MSKGDVHKREEVKEIPVEQAELPEVKVLNGPFLDENQIIRALGEIARDAPGAGPDWGIKERPTKYNGEYAFLAVPERAAGKYLRKHNCRGQVEVGLGMFANTPKKVALLNYIPSSNADAKRFESCREGLAKRLTQIERHTGYVFVLFSLPAPIRLK